MNGKKIPAYHLVQVHKQAMRVGGFIRPSLEAARNFGHKHRLATYGALGILAIGVGAGTAALQSSMMTDGSTRTTLTASTNGTETTRGGQVITTTPGKTEPSSQTTASTNATAAAPAQNATASSQPAAQSRPTESAPTTTTTAAPSNENPGSPGMALTVQQQDYAADQPAQKFYLKLNRTNGYTAKVASIKTKVNGNNVTCDVTAQNGDVYELTCSRPSPVPSGSTESGTMTVLVTTDTGDNFAASTTYRLPLPS